MRFNSGQSNLIVILLLGTLALVVLAAAQTSINAVKISHGGNLGLQAYQAAEAGVERIYAEYTASPHPVAGNIYTNQPFLSPAGETLGTYSVSVSSLGSGQWQIESLGKNSWAQRKVKAIVKVSLGGPNFAFSKALFSNTSLTLPSNSNAWGDIYVNGQLTWPSGNLWATDALGTHFTTNPAITEAPYGRLTYYFTGTDAWRHTTSGATSNGDARGYWNGSQTWPNLLISPNNVWLDPELNIGDTLYPSHPNSGQYWNRSGGGVYSLTGNLKGSPYNEYTGLAVKNTTAPLLLPKVGNGAYSNFAGYYNLKAPVSTKFANLAIYENSLAGNAINLNNGRNAAIIGSMANANGFAQQFIWNGTATRDNGTTYTGSLVFPQDFILYIDGDAAISGAVANNPLTIIASGAVTISTNTLPAQDFNIIAFENINFNNGATLNGIYYSAGNINFAINSAIAGGLAANGFNFNNHAVNATFHQPTILKIAEWLPGSALPTVQLISFNEVEP